MQVLVVVLMFFGQLAPEPQDLVDVPPPPAPADSIADDAKMTVQEMRAWLLTRLMLDMSFDVPKSNQVRQLLETMDETQMKALINAYKERKSLAAENSSAVTTASASELDQAKLNLLQVQAYRDHLKREYDRRVLQGTMEQNLVYQNLLVNQRLMQSMTYPGYYGPYGAPVMNWGVPAYSPTYYGYGTTAAQLGYSFGYATGLGYGF